MYALALQQYVTLILWQCLAICTHKYIVYLFNDTLQLRHQLLHCLSLSNTTDQEQVRHLLLPLIQCWPVLRQRVLGP